MKFRTDFVTNSSSSSYMIDWRINYKDLSSESVLDNDECGSYPTIYKKANAIYFSGFRIKSYDELLACLYLYQADDEIDGYLIPVLVSASIFLAGKKLLPEMVDDITNVPDIDESLVPVLISVFQFLANNKSFSDFLDDIRKTISENEDEPEWADEQEIEELLDIDSDDYDDNELIDTVLELFGDFLGSDAFKNLMYVKENISNHQNASLSDVYSLSFSQRDQNRGEFINDYIEGLIREFGEDGTKSLPKMTKNDPMFEKEKNKWEYLVNRFIHQNTRGKIIDEFLHLDIDRGLESGEYKFLIEGVTVETEEELFFDDAPETSVISEEQKDKKENTGESHDNVMPRDLPEKDLYFRLYHCIDQNDIQTMRSLFATHRSEKHFSEYPITDLLAMAMELEDWDYLDTLLGAGFELEYSDVAHYIFNDTLETLYPLFDRGLKIDPSAYDDLITYASEHGKPEYTAWLLNRKNEDAQGKSTIE